MTTRSWADVVLYAASVLATYHVAFTRGSGLAAGAFRVLTISVPLTVLLLWLIRRVRPNPLYQCWPDERALGQRLK